MEAVYRETASILISISALTLGVYLYRQDTGNTLNRLLLLLCVWLVVRNTTAQIGNILSTGKDGIIALFKLNSFFNLTTFSLNLHFFLRLKIKKPLPVWLLLLIYMPALVLTAVSILDHRYFLYLIQRGGEWKIIYPPRNARIWIHIYFTVTRLYSLVTIITAFLYLMQARTNREKRQALVLFISLLVYTGALTAVQFSRTAQAPASLVYPSLFYLAGLMVAAARYRFLAPLLKFTVDDMIESFSDPVLLLDPSGKITTANRPAEELLDVPVRTMRDTLFSALICTEDATREPIGLILSGAEKALRRRLTLRKTGDDTVMTDTRLSAVMDEFSDLAGILVVLREIPGRREFRNMYRLTERELEIVNLVLSGMSNETVGESLNISERTVESHCRNIYRKLGIKNKSDLIRLSARFDLISPETEQTAPAGIVKPQEKR